MKTKIVLIVATLFVAVNISAQSAKKVVANSNNYDLRMKSYTILNLWKDAKGEAQPIYVSTYSNSKYGKKVGVSGSQIIYPGAAMTFKVGQIDTLLREVVSVKGKLVSVPKRYICFSVSVGSDGELRDYEIPYVEKTVAIVRTSADGEKFIRDEASINGGKAKKMYRIYLPNNYVTGNDEDAFFFLQNDSKYQVSLEDESFTTNTLTPGETVQITKKDASKANIKKGIWTINIRFTDPVSNSLPAIKTFYLSIPKNGGTIILNDEQFSNVTKKSFYGEVTVRYILKNNTPFNILVSGIKSSDRNTSGENDIVVINPNSSKIILVAYGANTITVTGYDQQDNEKTKNFSLIAGQKSFGSIMFFDGSFRLVTPK